MRVCGWGWGSEWIGVDASASTVAACKDLVSMTSKKQESKKQVVSEGMRVK